MRQYTILIQSTDQGLEWEHHFTMSSDEMAKQYTRKKVMQWVGVAWFEYAILYSDKTDIAIFKIETCHAAREVRA